MNWQDYKSTSHSRLGEIGILKDQYVCVHKIQSGMASEFRLITKEEYDSFANWKDSNEFWKELNSRKVHYIGYFGHHDFRKK